MILVYTTLYARHHFECISLGEVCTTAAALQAFSLRNWAYPFDWVISHFADLHATVSDDFKDYLNPQYFSLREDNHGVINKYGIVFVHDFPTIQYPESTQDAERINEGTLSTEWLQALPTIQDKYERRINRFKEKCSAQHKVYFFRHLGTSRDDAVKLRNLITSKYPHLDFVVIIISNQPEHAQQWEEQKIRNYYFNQKLIWNDIQEWDRIFRDLGIMTDDMPAPKDFIYRKYKKNLCGQCHYCQEIAIGS